MGTFTPVGSKEKIYLFTILILVFRGPVRCLTVVMLSFLRLSSFKHWITMTEPDDGTWKTALFQMSI